MGCVDWRVEGQVIPVVICPTRGSAILIGWYGQGIPFAGFFVRETIRWDAIIFEDGVIQNKVEGLVGCSWCLSRQITQGEVGLARVTVKTEREVRRVPKIQQLNRPFL